MSELFPAANAAPVAEVPVPEGEQAAQPVAEAPIEAPKAPRFASIHTLLMRIESLGDLASGTVYLRLKNGTLEPWSTSKIPSEKLLPLIEAGRVWVPWDHRYIEFDELGPEWPRGVRSVEQGDGQGQEAGAGAGRSPKEAPAPAPAAEH